MVTRVSVITAAQVCLLAAIAVAALVSTTLDDFFLAGSQPGQSGQLETPDRCDNCHGGYDPAVEPAHNWRGGMMSQAARDPFFYACMSIANQDAAFAGDLCIRCHSPAGWLEGRSTPTDGSALNLNDRQGVQCDFCHKLVRPSPRGVNPYPNDAVYTSGTYPRDQAYLAILAGIPPATANGMYVVDSDNAKRGPYSDAVARHQVYVSPFHRDAGLCGTCHDVSNPVFTKVEDGGTITYVLNSAGLPSASMNPYDMFPVERTFSEWMMSDFNTPSGVSGTPFGGNKQSVSTCQDCHMRDVTGKGANMKNAPVRNDLPLHDLTGGNTWVPDILGVFFPAEISPAALAAGKQRAAFMLQRAAQLDVKTDASGNFAVRVINQTGHKLPSGYPEGRRMWLHVIFRDTEGKTVREINRYDYTTAGFVPTGGADIYDKSLVFEAKLAMSDAVLSATGLQNDMSDPAEPYSFHFALNNMYTKDNRIPPRGYSSTTFKQIQALPVPANLYADGQYWFERVFAPPSTGASIEVRLFYQTVSSEYVTFLRDENRTDQWGSRLYAAWDATGKSAPVLMTSYSSAAPTNDNQAPSAPAGLSATALSSKSIALSWQPSTDNVGVTGYHVYRADRGTSPVATVTTTTYTDNSLAASTTYTFTVRAFDAAGNVSVSSSPASATTQAKTGGKTKKELDVPSIPSKIAFDAFPTLFRDELRCAFTLPRPASAGLVLMNEQGQEVRRINGTWLSAGQHNRSFGTGTLPAGVYFVRLDIGPDGVSPATSRVTKVLRIR